MRKTSAFLPAAIIAAAFLIAFTSAFAGPVPQIAERTIDFGKIEQGKSETKTVKITNAGDAVLEITKITPSAPCFIPDMKNKSVEPGAEGEIEIKFDSAGMEPSRIVKYVYVYTKDPAGKEDRSIPLTCSATVVPASKPMLQLEPYKLDLGVVYPGQRITKSVKYRNVGSEELTIEPIQYLDRRFTVVANISNAKLPALGSGEEARPSEGFFSIAFEAMDTLDDGTRRPANPGPVESYIIIKSNSAGGAYSRVAVRGFVAPPTMSITGIKTISPQALPDQPSPGESLNFMLSNYHTPYKLRATILSGPNKGRVIMVQDNATSSVTAAFDPASSGKVVSIQLDIIVEEPKPEEKPDEPVQPEGDGEVDEPVDNGEDIETPETPDENGGDDTPEGDSGEA